eukprot:jgi/Mesvir1/14198/Mv09652-RA.1
MVAFPTWPTYYRLKALEDEMAKAAGVEQSEDGTFVSASLEQEEEMLKTLHEECGVYIKAKHVKATSKSGNARAPEKPTIIGREALSLLEKFDVCVDKLGEGLPPGKGPQNWGPAPLLSGGAGTHAPHAQGGHQALHQPPFKLGRDAKGKGMGVSMLTQGMKADKVRQKSCREVPLPLSDTEMRARKRINAMPPVE